MSGGEQQRVAIARAIVNHPAILLADEPTGNLDTENSNLVLGLLTGPEWRLGQTIVMITHNPEAAAFADRIVTMRDGRIEPACPHKSGFIAARPSALPRPRHLSAPLPNRAGSRDVTAVQSPPIRHGTTPVLLFHPERIAILVMSFSLICRQLQFELRGRRHRQIDVARFGPHVHLGYSPFPRPQLDIAALQVQLQRLREIRNLHVARP